MVEVGSRRRAIGAIVGALLLAACGTTGVADSLSAPLLAQHGLRPTGATVTTPIEIGDPAELPWNLYHAASAEVGLGDGWHAGAVAELRTTPIEGAVDGVRAHVLVEGGRVVGAWLSHPTAAPGIYPLSAPP